MTENRSLPENILALSPQDIKRTTDYLQSCEEREMPPRVKLTRNENGGMSINPHPNMDPALYCAGMAEAFGTVDTKMIEGLMEQLLDVTCNSPNSERAINDAISTMHAIRPQDSVEAMLVVQMVAIHKSSLSCLSKLHKRDNCSLDEMNSYINQSTKLSRTYVAQMEALNRHRGKGQQKMTVEHIHVNAGGQAIIGNVEK